jgi:hypothetical protein
MEVDMEMNTVLLTESQAQADNKFTYYAFISYSRKDEKWAKLLQKKLESYRLPSVLQKVNPGLPKRLTPVFRDKTDLTTGTVKDALSKELCSSKFLIVICSPNSAHSQYVDYEVETFKKLGREKNIIPFIVDGIAGSDNPVRECFTANMLNMEDRPLGISVLQDGKRTAFIKTVSALLELRVVDLEKHETRRIVRHRTLSALGMCGFLILCMCVIMYCVPRKSYYVDYVEKFGVPQGICQLSKQDIKSMFAHYCIVEQFGNVREISYRDSEDYPMNNHADEHADRPIIAKFYYTDSGRISSAEYLDRSGKVLMVRSYTTDLSAVDFQESNDNSTALVLTANSSNMRTGVLGLRRTDERISKSDITRQAYASPLIPISLIGEENSLIAVIQSSSCFFNLLEIIDSFCFCFSFL